VPCCIPTGLGKAYNDAEVRGKYKGKNKYITAHVNWDRKNRVPPVIREIEVTDAFYEKIRGDCNCNEWYETRNI